MTVVESAASGSTSESQHLRAAASTTRRAGERRLGELALEEHENIQALTQDDPATDSIAWRPGEADNLVPLTELEISQTQVWHPKRPTGGLTDPLCANVCRWTARVDRRLQAPVVPCEDLNSDEDEYQLVGQQDLSAKKPFKNPFKSTTSAAATVPMGTSAPAIVSAPKVAVRPADAGERTSTAGGESAITPKQQHMAAGSGRPMPPQMYDIRDGDDARMAPCPTTPLAKRSAPYESASPSKVGKPTPRGTMDQPKLEMQGEQPAAAAAPIPAQAPVAGTISEPSSGEIMNMLHSVLGAQRRAHEDVQNMMSPINSKMAQQDERLQRFEHDAHARFQDIEQRLAEPLALASQRRSPSPGIEFLCWTILCWAFLLGGLVRPDLSFVRPVEAYALRPLALTSCARSARRSCVGAREESFRNKKLVTLADVMQKFLKEGEPDCIVEPWTMVCWRNRKITCSGLRRVTFERDEVALCDE